VASDDANPTADLTATVSGDRNAAERLMPLVYSELRALAGKYLKGERPGHTLQPTALVHEAYLRLIDISRVDWRGKTHFYAMAARQMRRILVDHARAAAARKRGARALKVTLDDRLAVGAEQPLELLALDEALSGLARRHPRQARVAELRLFSGMEVKTVAAALEVSERTVKGDWRLARAWLMRALDPRADS
jgi:RNA polymerase sigma-70 factor (ECF subfamily)